MKTVDARRLACPDPVMLTMKALSESDEVLTIVDNEAARDNVSRLAKSQDCDLAIEEKSDGFYLTLRKPGARPSHKAGADSGVVALLASEYFGRGDSVQLSALLMQSFLHTLGGLPLKPEAIILVNSGVKLATEGSPVLAELRALHEEGVEVLACGTCLNHFHLLDKVAVGQVSNMYTIADTLLRAGRVVAL